MFNIRRKGLHFVVSAVTAASVLSGGALGVLADEPDFSAEVIAGNLQEEAESTIPEADPAAEAEPEETEALVGGGISDVETPEIDLDGETDIKWGTLTTKYKNYEYTGYERKPAPIVTVDGKTLVKDQDYTVVEYRDNRNIGTAIIVVEGIGNYKGTLTGTFNIVAKEDEIIPIYRCFNPRTGEHFYTKHKAERDACVNYGWNAEGIAWYSPEDSDAPVYRLMNPNNKSEHHYTTSLKEKNWLVKLGWNDEGIAFYSCTNGGVPVYRLYHPIQKTGNHHYTTSKGESDYIAKNEGWNQEGIGFYVSKSGG